MPNFEQINIVDDSLEPTEKEFIEAEFQSEVIELSARVQQAIEKIKSRQDSVAADIFELKEHLTERTAKYEKLIDEYDTVSSELIKRSRNIFSRTLNWLKINEIQNRIHKMEVLISEYQESFAAAHEVMVLLEIQAKDEREIDHLKEQITDFRGRGREAYKKLVEFQALQAAREVSGICRRHNCLLIHSFSVDLDPSSQTSVLINKGEGIGFEKKIDIITGLSPELSTTSFRLNLPEGEKKDSWFIADGVGLILKGGQVSEISRSDAGTSVRGMTRESSQVQESNNVAELEDDLDQAIHHKTSSHNEITIKKPEIGGLIFSVSNASPNEIIDHRHLPSMVKKINQMQLPIYIQTSAGKIFRAELVNERILVHGEVNIDNILDKSFAVDDDKKKEAQEAIFNDAPFNLDMPEKHAVDAYQYGKDIASLYMVMTSSKMSGDGRLYVLNQATKLMARHRLSIDGQSTFEVQADITYFEGFISGLQEVAPKVKELYFSSIDKELEWQQRLRREIKQMELGSMDSQDFDSHQESLQYSISKVQKWYKQIMEHFLSLSMIATALLEEVSIDVVTRNEIKKIFKNVRQAAESVPESDYHQLLDPDFHYDLLARRLGNDGLFKMTKDDLKHVRSL
ncbi:hypothetical protein COT97_04715 [Candidatus Falkowbacteria bacterium CG10_big_fil_rev_8_21_14_0_10_39_11]|uniref:Uncharacterized protein n=1 Tax=Candidatus Falkowbacteria bacterium CG10_big_fil_rev_8_21_14_0_10_39_11 TaxID=1974565 RepID=A0A2H0V409_9BACT|nr:MAG: hypothetical protein COT97_04715 [Candidatus Falkowbacteria bacterium CG10_big_fil_rev_8_21_14_0_10_39_11]